MTHSRARYNTGIDVCDRWADGSGRLAIVQESWNGRIERYTFDVLKRCSDGFAHALRRDGVRKGDRVGIFLCQSVETAIAHVAVYKCGAIAVPLFALFGPDALQYRLADSGVRAFWPALNSTSEAFDAPPTSADDPAVIIYTPGTTGKPKGALHAHRVLPGHLPGVEMSQGFFPDARRRCGRPLTGPGSAGSTTCCCRRCITGVAVLARRLEKFDAPVAFDFMQWHACHVCVRAADRAENDAHH
jgi:acetyl-CoA synthetase